MGCSGRRQALKEAALDQIMAARAAIAGLGQEVVAGLDLALAFEATECSGQNQALVASSVVEPVAEPVAVP